ncbi:MAG: fibronectin type III domain-containing protein, partial [Patescibacteria group bacterium]
MYGGPRSLPSLVRFLATIVVLMASGLIFGWVTSNPAYAATLYWVGDDGANTSVASNWVQIDPTGCGGGNSPSPPSGLDLVIFDADCDNGATINSAFSVQSITMQSGYTGTVTQSAAITLTSAGSAFSQAGGTFAGGSSSITLSTGTVSQTNLSITGGTFTSTSGTLSLTGGFSRTGGTFNHNSGTVTFAETSLTNFGQTLTGETFYNLTIENVCATPSDTCDVDPSAAVTVTNTLTVTDGQFSPPTSSDFNAVTITSGAGNIAGILKPDSGASITVSGNWDHAGGTFTANSGTVTFDGTSQTLNDDNTFYNLTKTVTSADTLTLEASATQTVTNTTTLRGADCAALSLRSSAGGTQWSINPQGTRTVDYLNVKDSNNTNSTAVSCTTGCASSGNNTNWTLSGTTCSTTGSSGNTAPTASVPRSITQTGDNIEFKTDINDTNGDKTQLLVEYSSDQSNWKKATISKVSASQGDVTITASATYPIQSVDTDSGKITLTITWNAGNDFQSEESKMYLRLTPYDGTDAGTAVISESFAVDTRAPVVSDMYLKARTSTSLTPAWTPEAEKNFDKYVLCYGTDLTKVKNCTTTGKNAAKQWTTTQDSKLATFTTSQTTITGLAKNKTHHILLKATDKFNHTSTLLLQSVTTSNAPAAPHLTVTDVVGATISLAWTKVSSPTFTAYEICYGQDATYLEGFVCPAGTVRLTFTNPNTVTTTLTGLKEKTLYYAKIWLRDSKHGFIAGNTVSATTCKAGETKVKGVCVAPPPPPPPPPACSDGLDNDGDGKVDFSADPGCANATDTNETAPPPPAPTS